MKTRAVAWMSVLLAVLVGVTGWAGLFRPGTYERETRDWATQAIGGDAVNLFLVVPLLLVSGLLLRRGPVAARLLWLGAVGYLLYNFLIYCFAVHFNALFLVYCAVLGVSFYGFIVGILQVPLSAVATRRRSRLPAWSTAAVFLFMAVATSAQWLREIVAALRSGTPPPSATSLGMPVNPVWVLDLCFLLPALAVTAVLLLRGRPLGTLLAPVLLTVLALIGCELLGIGWAMQHARLWPGGPAPLVFFAVLVTVFTVLLVVVLRAGVGGLPQGEDAATGRYSTPS